VHDRDLSRGSAETYEAQLDPEAKSFGEGNAPSFRAGVTCRFWTSLLHLTFTTPLRLVPGSSLLLGGPGSSLLPDYGLRKRL
jgi:hypothetical protein